MFAKPTHEKLIKGMYPPLSRCNEPNLKPENVGRLHSFALRNPQKLPAIAAYIERRIRKEIRRSRVGYVSVMVQGMSKLIEAVYTELDLLEDKVSAIVLFLIVEEQDTNIRCLAASLLETYARYQDHNGAADSENLKKFVIPLLSLCVYEDKDTAKVMTLREAGMKALIQFLLCMDTPSLEREMHVIVPVILSNIKLKYDSTSITESFYTLSLDCLRNLSSVMNVATLHVLLTPLFEFMNQIRWAPTSYVMECLKLATSSINSSGFNVPPYIHIIRYIRNSWEKAGEATPAPATTKTVSGATGIPKQTLKMPKVDDVPQISFKESRRRIMDFLMSSIKLSPHSEDNDLWLHEICDVVLSELFSNVNSLDKVTDDDNALKSVIYECCTCYSKMITSNTVYLDVLLSISNFESPPTAPMAREEVLREKLKMMEICTKSSQFGNYATVYPDALVQSMLMGYGQDSPVANSIIVEMMKLLVTSSTIENKDMFSEVAVQLICSFIYSIVVKSKKADRGIFIAVSDFLSALIRRSQVGKCMRYITLLVAIQESYDPLWLADSRLLTLTAFLDMSPYLQSSDLLNYVEGIAVNVSKAGPKSEHLHIMKSHSSTVFRLKSINYSESDLVPFSATVPESWDATVLAVSVDIVGGILRSVDSVIKGFSSKEKFFETVGTKFVPTDLNVLSTNEIRCKVASLKFKNSDVALMDSILLTEDFDKVTLQARPLEHKSLRNANATVECSFTSIVDRSNKRTANHQDQFNQLMADIDVE